MPRATSYSVPEQLHTAGSFAGSDGCWHSHHLCHEDWCLVDKNWGGWDQEWQWLQPQMLLGTLYSEHSETWRQQLLTRCDDHRCIPIHCKQMIMIPTKHVRNRCVTPVPPPSPPVPPHSPPVPPHSPPSRTLRMGGGGGEVKLVKCPQAASSL